MKSQPFWSERRHHGRSKSGSQFAMFFVRTTVLVGLAFVSIQTESAQAQWTQWGGPRSDFSADASGLSRTPWSETGPDRIWERDLGDGYSAILVDDGRLYTMMRDDEKEVVVCLNANDGKTIWQFAYDSDPAPGHEVRFGTGPRATPLIVGDRIFTIGISGTMHCLNKKDGSVHWKKELWKDMTGTVLPHGYSSSPVAFKNMVITLVGGKGNGLVAFDQKSGKTIWHQHDFKNSYSTPLIIDLDGKAHLVAFMAKEIVGADPDTGDLKWRYEIGNQYEQNVSLPVWDKTSSTLFFSVMDVGSRGLQLSRKGNDVETNELWDTRKIRFYHVTAVKIGDMVYGSSSGGGTSFLSAINMKTGDIAWRKRGFAQANCVLADGRLVILDQDGQLALGAPTAKGLDIQSKFKLFDDVAWTVPTIVGKTLYVRDKQRIVALDLG